LNKYNRIVTHNDFDGIASGALCSYILQIDHFLFTGPRSVNEAAISITDKDVVCDLPYPLECGLWFDHHEGNLEELKYRGIDHRILNGRFELKPSCARVVFEYFKEEIELPLRFTSLVKNADIIDSFNYRNIQAWREETPAKKIEGSLRIKNTDGSKHRHYLLKMVRWIRDRTLEDVAGLEEVHDRYEQFKKQEQEMIDLICQDTLFLSEDTNQELVIIDLTRHNRPPHIYRNLAYLLYPKAKGVLEMRNRFQNGIKTNDLTISMSLSFNLNGRAHKKNVGEIMRQLNIGDGHPGAGGGMVSCQSKKENHFQKESLLNRIFKIWRNQEDG